jgi:hypothetical protein
MGAGDEMFGYALAHFLRRTSGGPIAEIILLGGQRGSASRQEQAESDDLDEDIHLQLLLRLKIDRI